VTTIAGWLLWRQIRANMLTNRRSRMLLRNAQDGIHVLDRQGKLLQGSDSFFRMIGSTPQAALGKTLCYWDNDYNKAELQELINRGISTPGGIRFETCYLNAQGECYPVEVSSSWCILMMMRYSSARHVILPNVKKQKKTCVLQRPHLTLKSGCDYRSSFGYFTH